MYRTTARSAIMVVMVVAVCSSRPSLAEALNENFDIDIKVDTDSKLYHQGKTVEGSFNYGYNVPRRNYNQYQHKVKGPDGVTYGCYGFVDPTNGTHLYHYVADLKGYRVVPPNKPTRVYSERVANSVADIYDSVGITYDWEKLYFPDVCRVLQRSKDELNELSIPKGFRVNDDGSVTQTTTTQKPKPAVATTRQTPSPTPYIPRQTPSATAYTPRQISNYAVSPTRPATPRPTRGPEAAPTTRATPTPTPTAQRTTPIPATPARTFPPTTAPRAVSNTPRPTTNTLKATQRPTAPRTTQPPPPRPPPKTAQVAGAKNPFKPNSFPATTPKSNGNKYGSNRDNFVGAPTNAAETLKPPQSLHAVGQEISELKTLLQMLLKSLNNNGGGGVSKAGADCGDGFGAVDPNAKQVFLPLVIVDALPGARQGSPRPGGVPAGSQFAIPSVGYGAPRCNACG